MVNIQKSSIPDVAIRNNKLINEHFFYLIMARPRIPKVYGQSMVESCPFCGKVATAKSEQGAAVCAKHTKTLMVNIKCNCGDYLDLLDGRYGAYFNCLKCGNVNYKKGLDLWRSSGCSQEDKNDDKRGFREEFKAKWSAKQEPIIRKPNSSFKKEKKEIIIRSRDSFWFD